MTNKTQNSDSVGKMYKFRIASRDGDTNEEYGIEAAIQRCVDARFSELSKSLISLQTLFPDGKREVRTFTFSPESEFDAQVLLADTLRLRELLEAENTPVIVLPGMGLGGSAQ